MANTELAVVIALALGGLLLLRWLLIRLAERFLGPHAALRRVPLTRAADVAEGEPCRVAGVARRHPDHPPVTGRFSGKPALIQISELLSYDRSSDSEDPHVVLAEEQDAVELFSVEDESGSVLVRPLLAGTERRLELERRRHNEVPMDRVEALLARSGKALADVEEGFPWGWSVLPGDYHVREALLTEGTRVVVVGIGRSEVGPGGEGAYREAPPARGIGGGPQQQLYVTNLATLVERLGR